MKLILDVDGTVNAPDLPWTETVQERTIDFPFINNGRSFIREETIRWDAQVLEALGNLIWSENLEVLWLTGWREQASKFWDDILGIRNSEVINWEWSGDEGETGKNIALSGLLEPGERFIWADDVATKNNFPEACNGLLVTPTEPHCLTLQDVSDMINFIR